MLELHDLHRRYGDVVALDGVSLVVRPAALAVTLALGSMWLLMGLAARIYSGAALRFRGAVRLADAWRGGGS